MKGLVTLALADHCPFAVQPYPASLVVEVAEPEGDPGGVLMSRLSASVAALVMPVSMNARICGHHASMVLARVVTSGTSARPHQS